MVELWQLYQRLTSGSATHTEKKRLIELMAMAENETEAKAILADYYQRVQSSDSLLAIPPDRLNMIADSILLADHLQPIGMTQKTLAADLRSVKPLTEHSDPPVRPIHFIRMVWVRYAAAVILIAGLGAYLWDSQQAPPHNQVGIDSREPVQNNVLPGSDRAVLTLSDGKKVELGPELEHTITDGSLTIHNIDGRLTYGKSDGVGYNTMSTPKGGQYQVTLPDGTRVWLNAASSITYPTAFTGHTRSVRMTGEAYFEVAKNTEQPFLVETGETVIKVLGTHFNVNNYMEEGPMRTTLFEGRVEVSGKGYSQIMKPGEQAAIAGNSIEVKTNINTERVLAWKEGKFYFAQDDLKSILGQFERWYDVEVIYEGTLKNRKFFGIIDRSSSLSVVLELLKNSDIKFNIEGKKLYVQSD